MSVVAVYIIFFVSNNFLSEIVKLFEENFHQGIKLHIIYFSLIDINIRTVIIIFSIHLPSVHVHTHKSLSDEPFMCVVFVIFPLISPRYSTSMLTFLSMK